MDSGPPVKISVIGCEILEDEIIYLVENHEDIDNVVVLKNEDTERLMIKLEKFDSSRIHEVESLNDPIIDELKGLTLIVWIKPMALHSKPDKLRDDVISSIKELERCSDCIILFYGLCGNAFKKIEDIEADFNVPVIILRDSTGEVVDDCIGLVLGGSEKYLENLRKFSGTFFLTPMWADNWREMFNKVQILEDPDDVEGAKYVFDCVGYKRVVKLDTGLGEENKFEDQVQEFADLFEFERDRVPGTLEIIDRIFTEAKELSLRNKESGSV
jgi:hypothetical protein